MKGMTKFISAAAFCWLGSVGASAQVLEISGNPDSEILSSKSGFSITREDIERYIAENLPAEQAAAILRRPGIFKEMAESLYIIRAVAAEAKTREDFDTAQSDWARQMMSDRRNVAQYRIRYVESQMAGVDWDALAMETYKAEPERFQEPEQVHASHILVGLDERTEEEAIALAKELRERAAKGEDFGELAKEFSDDSSASRNAGDLGFFPRGQMVKPFEEVAFGMTKAGEISEPVKSRFGYHIIRYEGRKPAGKKPFDQAKNELILEAQAAMSSKIWQDKMIQMRSNTADFTIDAAALESLREEYVVPVDLGKAKADKTSAN